MVVIPVKCKVCSKSALVEMDDVLFECNYCGASYLREVPQPLHDAKDKKVVKVKAKKIKFKHKLG